MDRFEEEEERKKTRPIKNTWLINYIPKPIRTSVTVLKDKFIIFYYF